MVVKKSLILTGLLLMSVLLFFSVNHTLQAEDGEGKLVYVIPIENTVERGLEAFIRRTTDEAAEADANHIIFEINTPGGRVDAAKNIGQILQDLEIETTSFITVEALSAGSYIALNTDNIYMKPQASMGASGVINSDGTAADKKAQSAWIASIKSAASSKGRDPLYAEAMADPGIDLPEYGAPEGDFLTLGPDSAVEVGYAEGIVDHRTELLNELSLSNAEVVELEPTVAEGIARFLTHPVVVPILLSLASIGLVVELYSPGFGIPGSIGIVSLILYFYGHIVAGLAGYEAIVLLVLGFVLIIIEIFAPGGIIGFIGIGAMVAALFMSTNDVGHMSMSIAIALISAIVVSIILFRTIGLEKGFLRHIILNDATSTDKGYVSTVNRTELLHQKGVTVTPLRPSGTAEFGSERLDVVSEGGFIGVNQPVTIIKVEGSRIVVREIKSI
ncbi:membrane-bound serine protease (ClpP class) [Gracilibacillus ureilyticus]|uniref:Membrane-bound serine protease (ClpP class) n=1 Tax=Gracilibacillus ureilyticus TaxID=531814 RepID=A0A1H9M2V7_9BACI|nr:nodulation protein NfeD [Gracilibacillus ureilyticus]SER18018.1 membrane-bound serine protease (ClpP class) [Gracilibacillus ureilyticus]